MNELEKILKELHPEIDYTTCKDLVDGGYFDSLDIVNLIVEISDNFDVEIPPQEIVADNFNSMQAIYNMIERLQ